MPHYINKSNVKLLVKEHNKRIGKDGLEALNTRVRNIVEDAVRLTGGFKTIKETEIFTANRKA